MFRITNKAVNLDASEVAGKLNDRMSESHGKLVMDLAECLFHRPLLANSTQGSHDLNYMIEVELRSIGELDTGLIRPDNLTSPSYILAINASEYASGDATNLLHTVVLDYYNF